MLILTVSWGRRCYTWRQAGPS